MEAVNQIWIQPVEMRQDRQDPQRVHLTQRQREVLALLCEGLSNKMICRRLEIAVATVKVHNAFIFKELGVSTRLQAVLAAHRLGLVADMKSKHGGPVEDARP